MASDIKLDDKQVLLTGSFFNIVTDTTLVTGDFTVGRMFGDSRNGHPTAIFFGKVGIGNSEPGYQLDVADRMRVRQANNTAGIWFYQTKPAKDQAFIGMSSDTQVGFYGNTGAGWGLVMDTSTGNVGIGTPDPEYKIDVTGRIRVRQANNTAGIWFYQTKPAQNQAFIGMSTDTQVGFWGNTGAGWGFVMDTTTGNVGIGTGQTTPTSKLQVNGSLTASRIDVGDLQATNSIWVGRTDLVEEIKKLLKEINSLNARVKALEAAQTK